jgi:hypothetical protein
VWLDFHIDADGEGHAEATRDFRIPDLASRSVIVHALGTDHATGVAGGRILCTDIEA